MKLAKNEKVIDIMQKTLDCVDARLINHGKRVAYIMYRTVKPLRKYSAVQLRDICLLAMLHDIGAYKTEDISALISFESFEAVKTWEHSAYGYLFIKHLSPLKNLAPALLFHHAGCRELRFLSPKFHELAQLIFLCDRADFLSQTGENYMDVLRAYLEKNRGKLFRPEIIDMFNDAAIDFKTLDADIERDNEFYSTLYGCQLSDKDAEAYLRMTILSIDFRSPQTVLHTIATVKIAKLIAGILSLDKDTTDKIATGAMLHDIGKTGIPVSILENPGRLSGGEMEIMRTHVNMTEKIITGAVSDEIKQIAVRHHEKLDGTGYPLMLDGDSLSLSERILAVADIFSALCGVRSYKGSYSKEKIADILTDMSRKGAIDANIASLAIDNYDTISEELLKEFKPAIDIYDTINNEYEELLKKIRSRDFGREPVR